MYLNLQEGGAPVGSAFGCCYICRTTPSTGTGTWVATGIDIYQEGELVFCLPCVKDLCSLIGFVSGEALEGLKENQKKLKREIKTVQKDLDEAIEAFRVVSRYQEPVAV